MPGVECLWPIVERVIYSLGLCKACTTLTKIALFALDAMCFSLLSLSVS